VAGATAEDHADAKDASVTLCVPEIWSGLPNLYAPVELDSPADLVVGHDRQTGETAAVQAANAGARLMLVVHTNPDELEMLKQKPDAAAQAEGRFEKLRRLSARADIVCAVGPRLARKVGTILEDGYGGKPVYRLDPGLTEPLNPASRRVSPECICLLVGRAEDIAIKGIDIAAAAFGALCDEVRAMKPVLWIRGAAPGDAEAVHAAAVVHSGAHRADLIVREYAPYDKVVQRDLLRSSLVLMPSRSEGFGLVALEALSRGTPTLISERSGLAEALREIAPDVAAPFIIDVRDQFEDDIRRWQQAIEGVLLDRDAAFDRTRKLRDAIAATLRWDATAEQLLRAADESALVSRA
jgi:glycosyltransferase involved in cell wall biosynthesis